MAKGSVAPWRGVGITDAVRRCETAMIERGLATSAKGYPSSVLSETDRRLVRPMPPELRELYSRVTPVPQCPEPEYGLVALQPADDPDLMWLDAPEARAARLWVCPASECWLIGWTEARLLLIGYTPFGDVLLWCEGLKDYPAGTIVLTDHDGDDNPIVLGQSLAEWLARYHAFDLVEYSIVPGSIDDLDPQSALWFLHDHLRLNPHSGWAREELQKRGEG